MKYILTALFFFVVSSAQADDCDCRKTIGQCSATFTVSNVTESVAGKSYAADVNLTSSQPKCSKISFYVDNTPYISVLNTTNVSVENVFGTAPIGLNNVSIDYCRVCQTGAQVSAQENSSDSMSSRFNAALGADFDKSTEATTFAHSPGNDTGPGGAAVLLDVMQGLAGIAAANRGGISGGVVRPSGGAGGIPACGSPGRPYDVDRVIDGRRVRTCSAIFR